jgi:hypothetical protein
MKLSFERGDAPPSTAGKSAKFVPVTPKKTPKKSKLSVEDDGEDTPTATPKRKRTPAKKNVPSMSKPDGEEDDEEEALKSKHAKLAPKAKPKPKNSFRASDVTNVEAAKTVVKEEAIEDDGDVFTDAPELATEDGAGSDEHEYICKFTVTIHSPAPFLHHKNGADPISACFCLLRGIHTC